MLPMLEMFLSPSELYRSSQGLLSFFFENVKLINNKLFAIDGNLYCVWGGSCEMLPTLEMFFMPSRSLGWTEALEGFLVFWKCVSFHPLSKKIIVVSPPKFLENKNQQCCTHSLYQALIIKM